ncbi:MAG TPA: peptidylprolyl isomerase [Ktedonobacterales bacterium]|jgi:hypothetical protein|nr:peptidylprolyl isomerase [Ktedonobacterales bacterium]
MTQHRNLKTMRWPGALLLGALLVMSVLSACAPNAASDPLLAGRVDGSPITLASYQRILAVYTAIDAQQQVLDWQLPDGRNLLASEQRNAFDFLVNLRLMRGQLSRMHVALQQKDIDAANKALQANIAAQREALKKAPDAGTAAILDQLTPDAVALYAEQEAAQAALVDKLAVPTVHVRGIIVATNADAERYEQQAMQGADFGALAKQYSLDKNTGAKGGDLGTVYVGEFNQVDPTFDASVFAPGVHPPKYVVTPFRSEYALFEVTQPGTAPIKSIADPQFQQTVFAGWLQVVVHSQAKIERYVAMS